MRFGERIIKERWMPWATQYVNYQLLKQKIKAIQQSPEGQQYIDSKEDFQIALEREIEKAIDPWLV